MHRIMRWMVWTSLAISSISVALSMGVLAGRAIRPTVVGRWLRSSMGAAPDAMNDLRVSPSVTPERVKAAPTEVTGRTAVPAPTQPVASASTPAPFAELVVTDERAPSLADQQILEDPNRDVPPDWGFSCH